MAKAPKPQKAPISIEVEGARTHNLRGIDCRIPHGRLTVVTGVSGAGKSSLAFDTVYAEAQRRFVESMSTYVRQFLGPMERPPMADMRHVLPALALVAQNSVKNARSTVGTLTETYDLLRLFFTHLGEVFCPSGHGPAASSTPQQVVERLASELPGAQVTLLADLARPPRQADAKLRELVRQGYFRRWQGGEVLRMTASERWPKTLPVLTLVLGRFRADDEHRQRLAAAVEEGYALAGGRLQVLGDDGALRFFSRAATCQICGVRLERPTPALFSFNSPLGACKTCQGFGRVTGIDARRVVPDERKTLRERPIAPWNSPAHEEHYAPLFAACRAAGVRLDVPWRELSDAERAFVWHGTEPPKNLLGKLSGLLSVPAKFLTLDKFFARLERKTYKMHVRILLARYRSYETCPDCGNTRLKPESLAVRVQGKNIAELAALSIGQLLVWLAAREFPPERLEAAGHLVDQLRERLETLRRVGLDYLSLDRHARTLSGGESQRIQLASALSMAMTGLCLVLDEPTIGLHPQDSGKLLALLRELAARGNCVLVVEHDRTLIEGADHVIDLGPRAGEHGGEVVAEGPLAAILKNRRSLTARHLRKPVWPEGGPAPARDLPANERRVRVRGAREHNLRGIDVEMPRGALVAVTGVSGSGKSTLVHNVIYGNWQRERGMVDADPGACDALEGLEGFADVVLVDQRPPGRSSRSNPATYTKAWDEVRKLFAASPEAKAAGIGPGHFSFNTDQGRCPKCEGLGTIEVDMQFMAALTVVCEDCQGRRFRPEVLAIRWQGRTVDQVLELTISEALEVFAAHKTLCRRLQALVDVGLGYLRLGQSTSTLSGGEAQRLKLASFLDARNVPGEHLFLFDEPTTGLHLADIELLESTLRRLLAAGHSVVVVEHSLDLIAQADWVIELGPGGGEHGGRLLYSGTLRGLIERGDTPTARELQALVRETQGKLPAWPTES